MKSLRELLEAINERSNAANSPSWSNGKMDPICVYRMPEVEIRVLHSGQVQYSADSHVTSFKLSDCLSYRYPTGNGGAVLTYKDFADLDWVTWACLYGEQRLEHNSDARYSRTFYGMQESGSLAQADYIRERGDELLVDPSYTPEQLMIQKESLEDAISCLSERHKKYARLRYLHNLTLAEAAIKMGCSYSAAAKIDGRVREKLRQNYLNRGGSNSVD